MNPTTERDTERRTSRSNAFTLIELLVVIAILAAMLLPALAKAKAINIQCVSDIKQVMMGINLFALDHGDRLPFRTEKDGATPLPQPWNLDVRSSWDDPYPTRPGLGFHIDPYPASGKTLVAEGNSESYVMICPAFVRNPTHVQGAVTLKDPDDQRRIYRLRRYVEGRQLWAHTSPRLGSIQKPSSNGAFADMDRRFPGGRPGVFSRTHWNQLPDDPAHGANRNYGFFDGHVTAVRAGDANSQAHFKETVTQGKEPFGWITPTQ